MSESSGSRPKAFEKYVSRVAYILASAMMIWWAWLLQSIFLACFFPVFVVGAMRMKEYTSARKWWLMLVANLILTACFGALFVIALGITEKADPFRLFSGFFVAFGLVQTTLLITGRVRRVWSFCRAAGEER